MFSCEEAGCEYKVDKTSKSRAKLLNIIDNALPVAHFNNTLSALGPPKMASNRPLTAVVRSLRTPKASVNAPRIAYASFSTTSPRCALPKGQPPSGYRLPPQETWENTKESALDKAGNYFMRTELFRGAYVVLEQFFRPPYVTIERSIGTTKLIMDSI